MDDITVDVGQYRLNCRAGGIIIHNNKALFHKNTKETYYALIGGRIKFGESSADAIKREIEEEIGKPVEIEEYFATVENFFELRDKKYHEILFISKLEFTSEGDKLIQETIKNIEGGKDATVQYEWLDLDNIDQFDIRPSAVKDILKEGKFPAHVINYGK